MKQSFNKEAEEKEESAKEKEKEKAKAKESGNETDEALAPNNLVVIEGAEDAKDEPTAVKQKAKCNCNQYLKPLTLLMGLGLHAVFEGIAIGLGTNLKSMIPLLVGISLHKAPASISLGTAFSHNFREDEFKVVFWFLFLFSLFSPRGIIIGIAATAANIIAKTVILGLATGTLIYIGASEVLVEEFSKPGKKWARFLVYLLLGAPSSRRSGCCIK